MGSTGGGERQHREIAWETPLGLTKALPEGKQQTGNTTTDRRFRAFDSKSGKELWTARLEGQVNAKPMTYQGKDGKQYVAIVATDSLVAYTVSQ